MKLRAVAALGLLCFALGTAGGQSRVAKRVIRGDGAGMAERLVNQSFEDAGAAEMPAASWGFWDTGYTLTRDEARTGETSARCSTDDPNSQHGVMQQVPLDQTQPLPVVAGGWSKAEAVTGSPGPGYSVYVDLEYMDGTPLWGRINPFDTGTHDWQYRQVIIVPEKPIRHLTVYGLLRSHTGTAYFDDFTVSEMALGEGAGLFDGVPVTAGDEPAQEAGQGVRVLVRDVGADSDFYEPQRIGGPDGKTTYSCGELALSLELRLQRLDGALRIDGTVADTTGEDRAIAVYLVAEEDFTGGAFGVDVRQERAIDQPITYSNVTRVGAGTNGNISRYPIAPVVKGDGGLCIGTPLDVPRVSRLAYDGASKELYAAFDLGLSAATSKFPSSASFSAVLYPFEAEWGFRAALAKYYELFPELFVKRVEKEGIWMPFTDIATVEGPEDFWFMFKEGNGNVGWDEQHGIYTFVYVEPMSHWLPMAEETPRTYEAAVAEVNRRAATEAQSQATLTSAFHKVDSEYHLFITDAPWCDGALITNNCDPDLAGEMTQGKHEFQTIERAFGRASTATTSAWRGFGEGFDLVGDAAHSGDGSARCSNEPGQLHGIAQAVLMAQDEPMEIVARAWSRAENAEGTEPIDYSLYLDIAHTDGSSSFGHLTPFRTGTHDWEQVEVRWMPEKPIQAIHVHALFRNGCSGMVWFDDLFLGEVGSEENLLKEPGFEALEESVDAAELDGTYIDSYEMAASAQNYRREHWASVDVPLTFDLNSRKVCSLGIFHTYEFAKELEQRMHGQGKLTFANAALINHAHPAHLLDVMGIETNWASGGEYAPNPDSIMNYRRALCYQKPYCLLLNTDYDAFKPEWVELYFKRCAFYAIFPSFFSHNAADDPYWQNGTLYNRDRPLFRKYIPLIKELAGAGWEPVTHARVESEGDSVWVERYGSGPEAGLFLTLFNDSDEEREYKLIFDSEAATGQRALPWFTDALTGEPHLLSATAGVPTLAGRLGAEDLLVLEWRVE